MSEQYAKRIVAALNKSGFKTRLMIRGNDRAIAKLGTHGSVEGVTFIARIDEIDGERIKYSDALAATNKLKEALTWAITKNDGIPLSRKNMEIVHDADSGYTYIDLGGLEYIDLWGEGYQHAAPAQEDVGQMISVEQFKTATGYEVGGEENAVGVYPFEDSEGGGISIVSRCHGSSSPAAALDRREVRELCHVLAHVIATS